MSTWEDAVAMATLRRGQDTGARKANVRGAKETWRSSGGATAEEKMEGDAEVNKCEARGEGGGG